MKYSLLVISLCLGLAPLLASASDSFSKEQLRSSIDEELRERRERQNRLLENLILDDQTRFYYDGNEFYPAIVINGFVFPAVVNGTQRQPGCVYKETVIEGKYDNEDNSIICELNLDASFDSIQGQTIVLKQSLNANQDNSIENSLNNNRGNPEKNEADARNIVRESDQATAPRTRRSVRRALSNQVKNTIAKSSSSSASASTYPTISSGSASGSNVLEVNGFRQTSQFGVRAGTWARVLLSRTVSSSEIADIELELLEDIRGINKLIPSGTIFFARHAVNPSTQRLDMQVNLMVLPDGSEHQVSASIHSTSRTAGLIGAVITHTEKAAEVSARRGLIEATSSIVKNTGSVLGNIAGNVAGDVLKSKERALPEVPGYSVQVAAQEALIRFSRSF